MERFTFMSDGYYAVDNTNCFEDQSEDYNGPAIDRLAAYEETGLLPDEVMLLKQRIAELEEQHRWIPVTERLPEDDLPKDSKRKQIKVLVSYKTNGRWVVRTQSRQKGYWYQKPEEWDWVKPSDPITYWKPLPELPKEETL